MKNYELIWGSIIGLYFIDMFWLVLSNPVNIPIPIITVHDIYCLIQSCLAIILLVTISGLLTYIFILLLRIVSKIDEYFDNKERQKGNE